MTHGPAGDSTSDVDYEESEHSGRVVRIASVAALGGLLFGYDSAVINGAVSAVEDDFEIGNADTRLRGRLGAARCGCRRADRRQDRRPDRPALGHEDRRAAVLRSAPSAPVLAPNVVDVRRLFRVIGGLGVGMASVIAPGLHRRDRRRHASAGGSARCSSWRSSRASSCRWLVDFICWRSSPAARARCCGWAWRPGGGCSSSMAVPAVLYGVLAFTIPESPRYLSPTPDSGGAQGAQHAARGEEPGAHHRRGSRNRSKCEKQPSWADLRKPTGRLLRHRLGRPGALGLPAVRRHQRDLLLLQRAVGGRRLHESQAFVITVITVDHQHR